MLSPGEISLLIQHKATYNPIANEVGYGVRNQSIPPTRMKRFELTNVCYQYQEVANLEVPQNVEVERVPVYWILTDKTLEQFTTEKQFLKIFPDHQSELKNYIKKEKVSFRKQDDIVKLSYYCNEIMK